MAPHARGAGLGKDLVEALVTVAEQIGYGEMRLDTLRSMHSAQALYRALGFEVIAPYYDTPVAGTLFMRRRLAPHGPSISSARDRNRLSNGAVFARL